MASFIPLKSYSTHPFTHISLSHHPSILPTVAHIIIIYIDRVGENNGFAFETEHSLVYAFDTLDLERSDEGHCCHGEGKDVCVGVNLEVGSNMNDSIKDKEYRWSRQSFVATHM